MRYSCKVVEVFFVLIDDFYTGRVWPLLEGGTEVLWLRSKQGLEFLAVIKMGKFGDLPHEIIEISLSFLHDLWVNNADRFVRDRRDETPRETFHYGCPHFVELVEPSENINLAVLVLPRNAIDGVLEEGRPSRLSAHHTQSDALPKLTDFGQCWVSVLSELTMVEEQLRRDDAGGPNRQGWLLLGSRVLDLLEDGVVEVLLLHSWQ